MKEIKIDGMSLMRVHGVERKFEVIDAVNELIKKMNEMNLTMSEMQNVIGLLKTAINESTERSKVEIGQVVYYEYNGRPKERP